MDDDLGKMFDQYLRDARVPVFDYAIIDSTLMYRWNNVIDGFTMPLDIVAGNDSVRLQPTTQWQDYKLPAGTEQITVDKDFFVITNNLTIK